MDADDRELMNHGSWERVTKLTYMSGEIGISHRRHPMNPDVPSFPASLASLRQQQPWVCICLSVRSPASIEVLEFI